ncbi:pentapeptide repeat-containing protein [Streptomyces violaceus]|uniref:pentapeptide repeat-containing protein n=1 Tax=Streptomyces violaceus TaxID=1936 RepID=UPI003818AA99
MAHLEGADLFAAHLEKADLEGAHLDGANLSRASLESARHLTVEQLVSACPRKTTFLPAHLLADTRVRARIDAVEKEAL